MKPLFIFQYFQRIDVNIRYYFFINRLHLHITAQISTNVTTFIYHVPLRRTVKSAGIDPSNGRELFYTKDGGYTYDFSYDDEVICGNTRPDVEGVIGTSLIWKGLSLTLNFRYQLGADVFKEELYNKVENISTDGLNYNQDKRALYERWQEPGDIVRFKNIASAATTPMSSRFVQREDVFTLESLNVAYEFYDGWIQRAGFSSLKFEVSMRDVFRASTIKSERGISYPFARTLEAGLSFNF